MDEKGLYCKYRVTKADGTPVDNCFILRPERDPAAVSALRAYATATENEQLREDLYRWVGKPMQKPLLLKPGMDAECDDNGLVPFYIEHRYTVEINAGIYDTRNDQLFYDMGEAMSEWIDNEEQGKTWRAWAAMPTDEERAAAKWE